MRTLKEATLNFEVKKPGNIWSLWFPKKSTCEVVVYEKTNVADDKYVHGGNIFFRAVSPFSGKEFFLRPKYNHGTHYYKMEDESVEFSIPRRELYSAFGCMTTSEAADYVCSKFFGSKK